MRHFFVPLDQINGNDVKICGSDAYHIRTVLRKKIGDLLPATDGQGRFLILKIKQADTDTLYCQIMSVRDADTYTFNISVFQAIPRGQTFDLIVEKLCELGTYRLIPVLTERSIPQYDTDKALKKQQRWQRISDETMKKVGRSTQMEVLPPVPIKIIADYLKPDELKIIPWELERELTLKELLRSQKNAASLSIFIGPEGGFSKTEVDFCVNIGFRPVTLGPRILKVETAAIATVANIFYEWG